MSILTQTNQFRKATPQPTSIITSADVNSVEINELRKQKEELLKQKAELEQSLALQTALQASRKIQSQHDKVEALKAKVQPDDKSGVSIIRNMPTNNDLMENSMLAILNAKRESKGLPAFASYGDAMNAPSNIPDPKPMERISLVPTTKIDPVTPLDKLAELWLDYEQRPLRADCPVYQIVSGSYFIAYNKSRAYVQKMNGEVAILVFGDNLYGDMALMSIIPNESFRDISRSEFDSIVKSKPSYKDLFLAFSKFRNCQNVYLPMENVVQIW